MRTYGLVVACVRWQIVTFVPFPGGTALTFDDVANPVARTTGNAAKRIFFAFTNVLFWKDFDAFHKSFRLTKLARKEVY